MTRAAAPGAQPILHLSLPVHDIVEARRFYGDVLGCPVGRVRDDWVDVWFFGMQLTLQHRPEEVLPAERQGVRHFGVAVADRADFDRIVARVESAGIPWLAPPAATTDPQLSGKRGAKVADPSGNVIELKHYDDPAALTPPR